MIVNMFDGYGSSISPAMYLAVVACILWWMLHATGVQDSVVWLLAFMVKVVVVGLCCNAEVMTAFIMLVYVGGLLVFIMYCVHMNQGWSRSDSISTEISMSGLVTLVPLCLLVLPWSSSSSSVASSSFGEWYAYNIVDVYTLSGTSRMALSWVGDGGAPNIWLLVIILEVVGTIVILSSRNS